MSLDRRIGLTTWFAQRIDAVAINRVDVVTRDGRYYCVKRRRRLRGIVIQMGNLFLRLANSQIHMFADVRAWQQWEVHSFLLLYQQQGRMAARYAADGIITDVLPGSSLRSFADQRTLTPEMMEAAALIFRKAHASVSTLTCSRWSHGDPHLGNVLYDSDSGEAYLIDFETQHDLYLSEAIRHADDLMVFLFDLACRTERGEYRSLVQAFLQNYNRPHISALLAARLKIPRGLEEILWKTRMGNCTTVDLQRWLNELKWILQDETADR